MPESASSLRLRSSGVATDLHSAIPNLYNKLSPNYLDAEEVVELLHVRHLELVGKERFDLIDLDKMLPSNHLWNCCVCRASCPIWTCGIRFDEDIALYSNAKNEVLA